MTDALEQKIAELRGQLSARPSAGEDSADVNQDIPSDLSDRLEVFEKKIQELTDEAAAWKRKYEFLSTDAPSAYQAQAAAEK
jgi:uncharacterized coiled-coil DUF342 family protein